MWDGEARRGGEELFVATSRRCVSIYLLIMFKYHVHLDEIAVLCVR